MNLQLFAAEKSKPYESPAKKSHHHPHHHSHCQAPRQERPQWKEGGGAGSALICCLLHYQSKLILHYRHYQVLLHYIQVNIV